MSETNQISRKHKNALKTTINEWWDSWHRFAEEGEKPPQHIQVLLDWLEETTGQSFDTDFGVWS